MSLRKDLSAAVRPGPEASMLWRDVLAVLVFVVIGRRTHDEGSAILGVLKTAAPFLIALPIGWLLFGALHEPYSGKSGLGTWITTLVVGMTLRKVVFGGGTAVPFVVVATVFLFVTMIFWRFLIWRKRRLFGDDAAGAAGGGSGSKRASKSTSGYKSTSGSKSSQATRATQKSRTSPNSKSKSNRKA
jgi:hypothetical protein